jgi:hypothetical protein
MEWVLIDNGHVSDSGRAICYLIIHPTSVKLDGDVLFDNLHYFSCAWWTVTVHVLGVL